MAKDISLYIKNKNRWTSGSNPKHKLQRNNQKWRDSRRDYVGPWTIVNVALWGFGKLALPYLQCQLQMSKNNMNV